MDERPPANAELEVEPSPVLVMESATDTAVNSPSLSPETTAESVALTSNTTTESVELSRESAEDSMKTDSDSSTKIEEISIDNTDGKVELVAENTTVIVNLAVDSGIVELASDGDSGTFQSSSESNEAEAEELLTDCKTGVERAHCRSSVAGLVDLASDSDFETVNLVTESSMALEEKFDDNIAAKVDLASDDTLEIVELEAELLEDSEESERPNVTSVSAYDDRFINENIGSGPEGPNNEEGPRSNGTNGFLEDSNSPNNSMGSRLNGPNGTLGPRNDGPSDSLEATENDQPTNSSIDGECTVDTQGEGDSTQDQMSSSPRVSLNRPQPHQPRAWVQLLSPRWIAFLLASWEVSFRRLNSILGSSGKQILTQWGRWNRVLIPLISGRGSGCCPRSLMGMSTRARAVLAEVGEQIDGGENLDVSFHESLPYLSIEILETSSEYTDDQSVWSGPSEASSWETIRSSSEQSLSSSSCSSLSDEVSDNSDDGTTNPKPIIEAPVEDLDSVDENDICKVCYSRRIARKAFGPCGHSQLCAVCISGYKRRHRCPICRRRIDMILNIY